MPSLVCDCNQQVLLFCNLRFSLLIAQWRAICETFFPWFCVNHSSIHPSIPIVPNDQASIHPSSLASHSLRQASFALPYLANYCILKIPFHQKPSVAVYFMFCECQREVQQIDDYHKSDKLLKVNGCNGYSQ